MKAVVEWTPACPDAAFLERVFAHRRLKESLLERVPTAQLVAFHARHKLQLMAHSPSIARDLGRIVATYRSDGDSLPAYLAAFASAMSVPTSRGKHVNVLTHAIGYLKWRMSRSVRVDLHGAVDAYAAGEVPLVVPVSLIERRVRDAGIDYLTQQTYFASYPASLRLPNAI